MTSFVCNIMSIQDNLLFFMKEMFTGMAQKPRKQDRFKIISLLIQRELKLMKTDMFLFIQSTLKGKGLLLGVKVEVKEHIALILLTEVEAAPTYSSLPASQLQALLAKERVAHLDLRASAISRNEPEHLYLTTGPDDLKGTAVDDEHVANAIAVYLHSPAYMKRRFPKLAAHIQNTFNDPNYGMLEGTTIGRGAVNKKEEELTQFFVEERLKQMSKRPFVRYENDALLGGVNSFSNKAVRFAGVVPPVLIGAGAGAVMFGPENEAEASTLRRVVRKAANNVNFETAGSSALKPAIAQVASATPVDDVLRNAFKTSDYTELDALWTKAVADKDIPLITYLLESVARHRGYDVDFIGKLYHYTNAKFDSFNPWQTTTKGNPGRGMLYMNQKAENAQDSAEAAAGGMRGGHQYELYASTNKFYNDRNNPIFWEEALKYEKPLSVTDAEIDRHIDLVEAIDHILESRYTAMNRKTKLGLQISPEEWNQSPYVLTPKEMNQLYESFGNKYDKATIDRFAEAIGYDVEGVTHKNVFEATGTDTAFTLGRGGVSVAVRNAEQLKIAGVTYDKHGNLIPLSQRFDKKKTNMNYAFLPPLLGGGLAGAAGLSVSGDEAQANSLVRSAAKGIRNVSPVTLSKDEVWFLSSAISTKARDFENQLIFAHRQGNQN